MAKTHPYWWESQAKLTRFATWSCIQVGIPPHSFGVDLDPLPLDAEMNSIASRLAGGAALTMLCPIFTRSACWVLERW